MDKLGRGYALAEHGLVLKTWPSFGYTHRIMTCALRLRSFVALSSIEAIDLHLLDSTPQSFPSRSRGTDPRRCSVPHLLLPWVWSMAICACWIWSAAAGTNRPLSI